MIIRGGHRLGSTVEPKPEPKKKPTAKKAPTKPQPDKE